LLAGTGLAAVFINISVENFAGWKYSMTFNIIQKSYVAGFIVYILINLVLVFSSVYIITQFSPAAAGSGIPEIKGYLNGEINSLNADPSYSNVPCTPRVLILIYVQELILTASFFSEL
jgi:H+/Cl- antiporter ClcA